VGGGWGAGCPKRIVELHQAAFVGIAEILAILLEMGEWDINTTSTTGRTALACATVGGHEDGAKIPLRRRDAKAGIIETECGGTPLS